MRISDWSSDVCSSDLKEIGPVALSDRSRRPVRYANQLPEQIERLIVEAMQGKPHWGARKIRELLVRRLNGDVRIPAKSTVNAVLDRHGLVKRAKECRRHKAKLGRASCRERVCQYVSLSVVAVDVKKKKTKLKQT